jgi:arginase
MSRFVVIEAPFHMGLENVGVGLGPALLLRAGADRALASGGVPAEVLHVRLRDVTATGLDAVVDINRQIRTAVRDIIAEGGCPVVLAGNCNSSLGTLGGMDPIHSGIVWFDAHGDFNTPETSLSGSLDGMALAAATGQCHEELRERIGMAGAVDPWNVLLLGWRELDPGEPARLANAGVTERGAHQLFGAEQLIRDVGASVESVYVHIDVDFMYPGRVPIDRAEQLLTEAVRTLPVKAIALTNLNPDFEPDGLTAAAAVRLLCAMASAASSTSSE